LRNVTILTSRLSIGEINWRKQAFALRTQIVSDMAIFRQLPLARGFAHRFANTGVTLLAVGHRTHFPLRCLLGDAKYYVTHQRGSGCRDFHSTKRRSGWH